MKICGLIDVEHRFTITRLLRHIHKIKYEMIRLLNMNIAKTKSESISIRDHVLTSQTERTFLYVSIVLRVG